VLESEGLVSIKRGAHGGARVQLPDVSVAAKYTAALLQVANTTIEDVFRARRILEPAAVRALAEAKSDLVVKRLRTEQEQERELVDDSIAFAASAAAFHRLLVELAGNKTLALFSSMLNEIVSRHHRATLTGAVREQRSFAEAGSDHHGQIIDLIAAGDAAGAEAFWRMHLDGAAEQAIRTLGAKTIVDLL
jgi:DNA-binding FadR family transcriptional regulator